MQLKDFYYDLPKELIAQDPLERRSESRLMVLDREKNTIEHRHFYDVTEYLNPGDCLVINDTRVLPARLMGVKEDTGASVEILLLRRIDDCSWETLVRPGKKCRVGARIVFGAESNEPDPDDGLIHGRMTCEVTDIVEDGNRIVRFEYDGIFEEILDELGQMPLPPYITHTLKDKNRYQTVYAEHDGSAAAPTAGLHFTKELLAEIEQKGVRIAHVTLHVGLGTFRPVKEENILDHHMHSEMCIVTDEAAELINRTRAEGGRIVSVGTTSTRTLESMSDDDGTVIPGSKWTDIFIYPGYRFKVVDALITNFHLPESTLIMLVSAFYDREHVLEAYKVAVEEKYRFFSFGDATLIL